MKINRQLSNILIGTGFGVTLYVVLTHLDTIVSRVGFAAHLIKPILAGALFAFVLNVPMSGIEDRLNALLEKRAKKHPKKKKKELSMRVPSLLLTLLIVVMILVLLAGVVAPQIAVSIKEIIRQIRLEIPNIREKLEQIGLSSEWVTMNNIMKIENRLTEIMSSGSSRAMEMILGTVSSMASKIGKGMIAAIFTMYILLEKERLMRHVKWVLSKIMPAKAADAICYAARKMEQTYTKFFSSQCIEAVILGIMIFVGFTAARLPYAMLVAILTAVTSFIPYIGCYLSNGIAAILIFMISPWKALLCIVVYQLIQFCENQFVYPRVVGGAVGLPPLYTLLAVFLGGALFGVVGMLFFIPLLATFYELLKEYKERDDERREENAAS